MKLKQIFISLLFAMFALTTLLQASSSDVATEVVVQEESTEKKSL